jgi:hypothetical protein
VTLTLRPTGLSSPAYRDWLDYVIVEDCRDVGHAGQNLRRRSRIRAPPTALPSALERGAVRLPAILIRSIDPKHISTSYAERQNLTMRMHMRRFTRLTNAFSEKVENHAAAVSLHAMYYNFVPIHQTLKATPAMAARRD